MDKKKIGDIMFDLFDKFDNYDEIKDALRSFRSEDLITDEEYNQCLEYWDEILLDWESQL